jgi:Domain of unknown function (DUF4440)
MTYRLRLLASVLGVMLVAAPAVGAPASGRAALGNKLVVRFFDDVRDHRVADLRKFLSPAFQIQRADGSRMRKAEYLRSLPTIRSYKMRSLRVTAAGDVLVATYEVAADQVIGGREFKTGYAPRISTFLHSAGGWQIVAHANFNTPK